MISNHEHLSRATTFPTRRLRFLFDTKSGATPKSETPEYWDGDIWWVTPDDLGKLKGREILSTRRTLTEEGYLSCGTSTARAKSIVLSKRAPIGLVAILGIEAACNQGCFLLTPTPNSDERFYYYCLLSWRGELETLGRGSTFMELSADDLRSIELPAPSLETQRRIADYLDTETAQIDALIAEKERMLELLEKKRTALINRAVTKGLDPDVPMRDSEIEWLGKIPAHWEIKRLKWLIFELSQGWSPQASNVPASENEVGILKLSAISKGSFVPEENKALGADEEYPSKLSLKAGDVLLTRANTPGLVGDACVVPSDFPNLLIPDLIYRIIVQEKDIYPEYLSLFLISAAGRSQIRADARGSSGSMVKISQEHIFNWIVSVPPLEEQKVILEWLSDFRLRDQKVQDQLQASIVLLKERRSALITAAVTGQLEMEGVPA